MGSAAHRAGRYRQGSDVHLVADAIPALVWSAHSNGSADFFNQRWLESTGLSLDHALDCGWKLAVHPDDPKSDLPENQTPAMARFKQDGAAQLAFANTVKLADVKAEDFDTVFYPGGHGPMWDLAESPVSIALLESFYNSGKPIALVCHSPGVLRHVKYQGEPLVKGKRVTGFPNREEEEVQLTKVVPVLVEDELLRLGAIFEKVRNWGPYSTVDGRLITGQNPASSTVTAKALLKVMSQQTARASGAS